MKLREVIRLSERDAEITVFDKEYDCEIYFYNTVDGDGWDKSMERLSKLLTVTKIFKHGYEVDLSNVIEAHIEQLKKADLFIRCDIDNIMYDMNSIISGNVSEEWIEKFVNVLEQGTNKTIE